MSKFLGKKTNNSNYLAKSKIRESVLSHHQDVSSVCELFCGDGQMYKRVWVKADKYIGIDIKGFNDERDTVKSDCLTYVKENDITGYNIFDIDAYGSPYGVLNEILKQDIKSNLVSFIITDGIAIDLRMGKLCGDIQKLLGINSKIIKNAHKMHLHIIKRVIAECENRLNGVVIDSLILKGKTGAGMKYYHFTIKRA